MGRNPEDGQNVLFEASENEAVDFFAQIETSQIEAAGYSCRLILVRGSVYAIYTNFAWGEEIRNVACDASIRFNESYFEYEHRDESSFAFWKQGQVIFADDDLPMGNKGERLKNEIQNQAFQRSRTEVGSDLWKFLSDFVESVSCLREDYLLEK